MHRTNQGIYAKEMIQTRRSNDIFRVPNFQELRPEVTPNLSSSLSGTQCRGRRQKACRTVKPITSQEHQAPCQLTWVSGPVEAHGSAVGREIRPSLGRSTPMTRILTPHPARWNDTGFSLESRRQMNSKVASHHSKGCWNLHSPACAYRRGS